MPSYSYFTWNFHGFMALNSFYGMVTENFQPKDINFMNMITNCREKKNIDLLLFPNFFQTNFYGFCKNIL